MKTYKVKVSWLMFSTIEVEADSLLDAMEEIETSNCPLPLDGDYIDGSFRVDRDATYYANEEEE